MARDDSYSQGQRWFILYNYLIQNTGKGRMVSRAQIFQHLANYDIHISANTLYADLDILSGDIFRLDIEKDKHAFKGAGGYYVSNPPFEPYELRLMVDSLQASKFITQKTADDLSRKLKGLTSAECGTSLNRSAVVFNRVKSMNESVVKEADRIYEAIAADKKIAFRYFHRTPSKDNPQKYTRDGAMLIVSPYALMWNNGNYYLYAYDGKKFRTFRIDRMDRISRPLLDVREGKDEYKKKDLTVQKATVFDMYHGKDYTVGFRCHNQIADAVIDRFGDGVLLIPNDADHFTFSALIEVSPPFYAWVSTFGHSIKITSPTEVVEGMKNFLQKATDMYEEEGEK